MHIPLETFNLLFAEKLEKKERAQVMDHVIECEDCAKRFKALRELETQMNTMLNIKPVAKRRQVPLRYILGVAAVMVMAISPYLSKPDHVTTASTEPAIASKSESAAIQNDFQLLDRIRDVNYRNAMANWNKETTVLDLVALKEQ